MNSQLVVFVHTGIIHLKKEDVNKDNFYKPQFNNMFISD